MDNDELAGRMIALEAFTMTALALYLTNARNDPDYSKAGALLEQLRDTATGLASDQPPTVRNACQEHADGLIATLRQNLRVMRGEGGTVQ